MASAIFYPLVLIICSLFAYAGNKYEKKIENVYLFILVIIFSFIFGVRVDFGIDQPIYLHMYEFQGADLLRCEPIFVKINQILYKYHFSSAFYFFVLSLINIVFICFSFKIEKADFLLGFLVYFCIYIFYYVNISRQAIAMNICLCSFFYFYTKNYFKWLILVFLAAGFHAAALTVLLILPILHLVYRINIPDVFYYVILIVLMLMFERLYDIILDLVFIPINLVTNGKFKIIEKFLSYKLELGSGMGLRLKIFGYLCLLPQMLSEKKKNDKFSFYFSIFFFGIVGELIGSLNINLQRIFYFYSPIQIVLLPKTIKSIAGKNLLEIKRMLFIFGIFILFFLFVINAIKGINNTSYYKWCFNF